MKHGMAPMAAVVAATREAATLTRLINRVGTLEVGKIADLVVVDGNPVEDIARLQHGIRMVVQAGVVRRDDLALATGCNSECA